MRRFYILACSVFFFSLLPGMVQAATLTISPSSGTEAIGSTFTVSVLVSSTDAAANAISGTLSFPSNLLEVDSLSKAGSVVNLWVQDPSFSNAQGRVTFEGIVMNPGFTGSAGTVVRVSFRVKASGTAALSFASGSVLANDGQGTNILSSLGHATFALGSPAPTPEPAKTQAPPPSAPPLPTPPASGVPDAPAVRSSSHPDSNAWYAAKDAVFNWSLPKGVTAARLLLGKTPNATPTTVYSPAISTKEIKDIDDGIWYFHVQLKNATGWGGVAHFATHVDTTPPNQLDIRTLEPSDPTKPTARFGFLAEDELSGIDHFVIKVDEQDAQVWKQSGSGEFDFETYPLQPGPHHLSAQAVDAAGNTLEKTLDFEVQTAPTSTEATSTAPLVPPALWFQNLWSRFGHPFGPFTFLLLGSIGSAFWAIYRKRSRQASQEVDRAIHDTFDELKSDFRDDLNAVKRMRRSRGLTTQEELMIKRLNRNIRNAEEKVKHEIHQMRNRPRY